MLESGSSDVCEKKKLCCITLCYLYVRRQEGPEDSQKPDILFMMLRDFLNLGMWI